MHKIKKKLIIRIFLLTISICIIAPIFFQVVVFMADMEPSNHIGNPNVLIDGSISLLVNIKPLLIVLLMVLILKLLLSNLEKLKPIIIIFLLTLFFIGILNINYIDCSIYSQNNFQYTFYKTRNSVCYRSPTVAYSNPPVDVKSVDNADPLTLEVLTNNLAKDSRHVYLAELYAPCPDCFTSVNKVGTLEGADPETFHIDENGIPRDKHRMYEDLEPSY